MVLHKDGIERDGKRPVPAVRPGPPDGPHEQTAEQDTTRARPPEPCVWTVHVGGGSLKHLEAMQDVCPLAMQGADGFGDRVPAIGQEESHVCVVLLVLGDGRHRGSNLIKLLFHRQRAGFSVVSSSWLCSLSCKLDVCTTLHLIAEGALQRQSHALPSWDALLAVLRAAWAVPGLCGHTPDQSPG